MEPYYAQLVIRQVRKIMITESDQNSDSFEARMTNHNVNFSMIFDTVPMLMALLVAHLTLTGVLHFNNKIQKVILKINSLKQRELPLKLFPLRID